jgi:hypothetical protein
MNEKKAEGKKKKVKQITERERGNKKSGEK